MVKASQKLTLFLALLAMPFFLGACQVSPSAMPHGYAHHDKEFKSALGPERGDIILPQSRKIDWRVNRHGHNPIYQDDGVLDYETTKQTLYND